MGIARGGPPYFEPGDRVECVDTNGFWLVEKDNVYTVDHQDQKYVYLEEVKDGNGKLGGWWPQQFRLVRSGKVNWASDDLWNTSMERV